MHGKQSRVRLDPDCPLFQNCPETAPVARYHSLIAKADTLPDCLRVTAVTEKGEVMAVQHTQYPIYGMQFHPESIMTPDGKTIQARGEVHGEVLRETCGEGGFGYDPIFYYPPFGKTLAQVSPEEKNQVSHRGQALRILNEKLKEAGYAEQ